MPQTRPHSVSPKPSQYSLSSDATTEHASHQQDPSPPTKEQPSPATEPDLYKPKTFKFWLAIFTNFITLFLVALDRTIIATAIPRITDDFRSQRDIGWYGSAYMLTTAAFQLFFGRVYSFYSLKTTYLTSIVLFEVGSLICAAAPSSAVFIVGRAVAGLGSAGIVTGSTLANIPLVPLHKRPMFQSAFAAIFGVATVSGPLIGGALTEHASWRWCFYMNLPIGFVAVSLLSTFKYPKPKSADLPQRTKLRRLDPLGTVLFIPATVSLLLALQWGGSIYPWSNWRIIVLLACFGLGSVAFATVQYKTPESASFPWHLVKQRSMTLATCFMLLLSASMSLIVYYLPLWFQTTHGANPVQSGLYTIPYVLSLGIGSVLAGIITQKSGYYVPTMISGPCFLLIAQSLLTTLTPQTDPSHWIGYQFLAGFGAGLCMQAANLAIQATVDKSDLATAMAICFFGQHIGGAVFVSVGQTVLSTSLIRRLSEIPGIDASAILSTGATELRNAVPEQYFGDVVNAYNYAITRIFLVGIAVTAIQIVSSFGVEWKSIKKSKS